MLFWNKAVFWWWGLAATAEKAAPLASETTETQQQQPLKQRQRRLRNGLRKRALQLQREGAPLENDLLRLLLLCRLRPASQLQPQPLLLTLFCFLLETRELATAFRAPPQRCRSLLKLCSSLCSAFCIHKAYILVWFKTSGSSSVALLQKKGFSAAEILCQILLSIQSFHICASVNGHSWTAKNIQKCQIASSHKYCEFDNRRPVAISLKKVIIKFWFRKFWTGVLEYL